MLDENGLSRGIRIGMAAIAALWANVPLLTQFLLILMTFDIALGTLVAIKNRSWNASISFDGIIRKAGVIGIIALAYVFEYYLAGTMNLVFPLIATFSMWFAVPELGSVASNAKSLGVELPPQFDEVLNLIEGFSKKEMKG